MRTPIRTLVLMSALIVSACSAIGDPPELQFATIDAAGAYDRGRGHFAAGHYGLAIKELRQAVNADSGSVETLNALAAAYDQTGRFDLAMHNYERALAINPSSVQTLNNIGYSYYLQNRFDVAVVYLEHAVALSGAQPTVHGNVDLVEQALSSQPVAFPAATQQLGTVKDEPPATVNSLQIVRVSRHEQVLTHSPADAAALPVAEPAGHPLLVGLVSSSPMTIGRPVTSPLTIVPPPISPLTIARPSPMTIAPPPSSEPRPVSEPELASAGFSSDYVITNRTVSAPVSTTIGSSTEPAVAKAFWIAGQPVPTHGATTSTSQNSSYW